MTSVESFAQPSNQRLNAPPSNTQQLAKNHPPLSSTQQRSFPVLSRLSHEGSQASSPSTTTTHPPSHGLASGVAAPSTWSVSRPTTHQPTPMAAHPPMNHSFTSNGAAPFAGFGNSSAATGAFQPHGRQNVSRPTTHQPTPMAAHPPMNHSFTSNAQSIVTAPPIQPQPSQSTIPHSVTPMTPAQKLEHDRYFANSESCIRPDGVPTRRCFIITCQKLMDPKHWLLNMKAHYKKEHPGAWQSIEECVQQRASESTSATTNPIAPK
jgi:hypothetical protein